MFLCVIQRCHRMPESMQALCLFRIMPIIQIKIMQHRAANQALCPKSHWKAPADPKTHLSYPDAMRQRTCRPMLTKLPHFPHFPMRQNPPDPHSKLLTFPSSHFCTSRYGIYYTLLLQILQPLHCIPYYQVYQTLYRILLIFRGGTEFLEGVG